MVLVTSSGITGFVIVRLRWNGRDDNGSDKNKNKLQNNCINFNSKLNKNVISNLNFLPACWIVDEAFLQKRLMTLLGIPCSLYTYDGSTVFYDLKKSEKFPMNGRAIQNVPYYIANLLAIVHCIQFSHPRPSNSYLLLSPSIPMKRFTFHSLELELEHDELRTFMFTRRDFKRLKRISNTALLSSLFNWAFSK